MQLHTPLGKIIILVDDMDVPYTYREVSLDITCPNLDGRYAIEVSASLDGTHHTIGCFIDKHKPSDKDDIESGENLESKSFYSNGTKLSLGMEGEMWSDEISPYDYDVEYFSDGVRYCVFPETKTEKYVFGIAWINNVTAENEVQTWYGADPSLMV